MKITPEEISHVAELAHLQLTSEAVAAMTEQLDKIISYVAKLNELDTTGVEPMTHAISVQNVFREDVVKKSFDQKTALANGPEQNGEAFVVPRVL